MPSSKGRSLSTVQVALRVMGFMTAHPDGVEAAAVAGLLGKSLSSAYSILNSFIEEGVAERVGSAYRFVASIPGLDIEPRDQVESDLLLALEGLYTRTHERVYLALWSEGCLKVVSRGRQGQPKPAGAQGTLTRGFHALAMGKAVLAWLPETTLEQLQLEAFTPFTITDAEVLRAEFEWIRSNGISVQLEEFSLGFSGLAAPIFSATGKVVGAFGTVMTTKRFPFAFTQLTQALREVAFASSGLHRIDPPSSSLTPQALEHQPKSRPQETSTPEWAAQHLRDAAKLQDYAKEHQRSLNDSDAFWDEWAQRFHWYKTWHTTLVWKFPEHDWFVGGLTNICFNAVDRHANSNKRNQLAIIALAGDGKVHKLCYRELLDRVARLASVFKSLAVNQGDRVATYLPTGLEAALCMLACARIGVIHVVIPAGLGAQAFKERLESSGAKLLVGADRVFQRGRAVSLTANIEEATSGLDLRIIWHCRGELKSDLEFWELLESHAPNTPAIPLEAGHPLFILYMSGLGDKPKGVVHTHAGSMVGSSYHLRNFFDAKDSDVIWCTGDLSWIFGHVYGLYAPLLEGLTTILREEKLDHPDPSTFYATLEQHGVNVLLTSPSWLRLLCDHGVAPLEDHDLWSLHLVVSGGEMLTPEVWHWTRDHLLSNGSHGFVIDHWWQTETGAPVLGTPITMSFKVGQVGVALPGVDAAVVDLNGLEVPAGTVGQLVIKRPFPHLFKGLWGDPGGFLALWDVNTRAYLSGDLAVMDSDGYFSLRGRVDDAIKAGDYLIGASEIEQVLTADPNVAEAAVIKLEHSVPVSALKIFVVFHDTNLVTEIQEVLKQRLQAKLHSHFGPTLGTPEIIVLKELPRSRGGTLLRNVLRTRKLTHILSDLKT